MHFSYSVHRRYVYLRTHWLAVTACIYCFACNRILIVVAQDAPTLVFFDTQDAAVEAMVKLHGKAASWASPGKALVAQFAWEGLGGVG